MFCVDFYKIKLTIFNERSPVIYDTSHSESLAVNILKIYEMAERERIDNNKTVRGTSVGMSYLQFQINQITSLKMVLILLNIKIVTGKTFYAQL